MRARVVSAAAGARWLATGWRLFRSAPLGWVTATLAYWFLSSLVSFVPFIGAAVAVALVPAFTVGFMALARGVERSGAADLRLLFDGFRHHGAAQAGLGVIYLAGFAAALAVSAAVDGGALAAWVLGRAAGPPDAEQAQAMRDAAVLAIVAYLPLMLAFWFAPPLAAWHSTPPGKALFFSLVACLMNWRALLAYGAVAAVVTLPLPFALALAAPLFVVLLFLLMPVLFASFYASYRDVFGYHLPQ